MAEPAPPAAAPESAPPPAGPARSKDEIALELMKFIAVTTGFGKNLTMGAGFSAKPGAKTPEEQADALIDLFERCRKVIGQ
jgi:hypothetical protein